MNSWVRAVDGSLAGRLAQLRRTPSLLRLSSSRAAGTMLVTLGVGIAAVRLIR